MPKLDQVLETVLYVDDLDRAATFYANVLGLRSLFADQRLRAFAVADRSMLLLFQRGSCLQTVRLTGGTIPPHDGEGPVHVAFGISADGLPEWEAWLSEHAIAIEGRTQWPRGGTSLYFRDPDRHLVELATPGLWEIY
jgi:catechol 2,3-dioxygenase-like lactoylglutathione lyase family enzyme